MAAINDFLQQFAEHLQPPEALAGLTFSTSAAADRSTPAAILATPSAPPCDFFGDALRTDGFEHFLATASMTCW